MALAHQLRRLDAVLPTRRCQRCAHHCRSDPFGRVDAIAAWQQRAERAQHETADMFAGTPLFALAADQPRAYEGQRGEADGAQIAFQFALDAVVKIRECALAPAAEFNTNTEVPCAQAARASAIG